MQPLPADFQLCPPSALRRFEALLGAVAGQPGLIPQFLKQVIPLAEERGLQFETGIIRKAVEEQDRTLIREAMTLFERPGRIFYALSDCSEQLARTLEIPLETKGIDSGETSPQSDKVNPDLAAQLAWYHFGQGAAQAFNSLQVDYDPAGVLGMAIFYLDRRGVQAHGGPFVPSFGCLSNDSPQRRVQYNNGINDKVGDVSFGFPSDLQMVVVPKAYMSLIRGALKFRVVAPASEILEDYCDAAWAKSLCMGGVMVGSIKGLASDASTPMEYLEGLIDAAEKSIVPMDLLGYLPVGRWMKELRLLQAGEIEEMEEWDLVLACKNPFAALAVATRWAGPEAIVRDDVVKDPKTGRKVDVKIVENGKLNPPLKITIVWDVSVICTNELASIYKNLEAIDLGEKLFKLMHEPALRRQDWDDSLGNHFEGEYARFMGDAEKDILKMLELEGIPEEGRVILPSVTKDLYGSWKPKRVQEMYELVKKIFDTSLSRRERIKAMILLKHKIEEFYSVRNPCLGFCVALDREIILSEFVVSKAEEAEATAELIREGLLESKDDKKKSRPTSPNAAENFLSVVPDHLLPEGFQIAEILPERCRKKGIKFKDLPNSFRSAHDIAQRMHHTTLVPAELRQKIVDLSQKMALIVSGDPAKVRSQFVGLAKELQGYFEAAMRIYSLNAKTLGNRTSPMLLTGLMLGISRIIEMLEDGGHFGAEQIVVLNQAVLEALTDAQLLAILPPSERDAQVSSLGQSMIRLACYVETGVFSDLYPELAGGEELSHEVAAQLNVIRGDVFMALGPGLISLTHAMSRGLNAENETFDKSRIAKAASNAARAIVAAQEKVNPPEAVAPFFGRFSGLLTDIATELSRKAEGGSKVIKFNASQRRSIYHALIVALIRARRFMVFPEEHAPQQLVQTLALLQQILDFTRTGSGSPLWPQT